MTTARDVACFVLVFAFIGVAGNFDYADALTAEAMEKEARVERQLREDIRRCREAGKVYYATKRDRGEEWRVRCIDAKRTRT